MWIEVHNKIILEKTDLVMCNCGAATLTGVCTTIAMPFYNM
jgi:hypothetical protein